MPAARDNKAISASGWSAVIPGICTGAKYGALAAASSAPIVLGIWWAANHPAGSGFRECFGILVGGIFAFGLIGGSLGGLCMAVVGFFRHRPPLRFSLLFLIVLMTGAGLGTALLVWLATPRQTTEDHAYVFLRLCARDRFQEAESYLVEHPEIATDKQAFGGRPTLYTAAYSYDDPLTAKLLLDHGAEADTTAAWCAARADHLLVFALLLEYGATLGPEHRDLERELLKAAYQQNEVAP